MDVFKSGFSLLIGRAIILLCFCLSGLGQDLRLPEMTEELNSMPEKQFIGPVSTVLSVRYQNGDVMEIVADAYDLQKNLLERITFSRGEDIHTGNISTLGSKRHYRYAPNTARLNEIIGLREDGSPNGKRIFHYDLNGRRTEERVYSLSGKLSQKLIYQYLPASREIVREHKFGEMSSLFEKQIFKLNNVGQVKSVTRYDNEGKVKDSTLFDYDNDGNLIKLTKSGRFNYSCHFAYKFDSIGNWIERTETYSQPELAHTHAEFSPAAADAGTGRGTGTGKEPRLSSYFIPATLAWKYNC